MSSNIQKSNRSYDWKSTGRKAFVTKLEID